MDHDALRILNLTDVSGRLARFRLRLSKLDFEVQYRPSVKHQLAAGMSRLRTDGNDSGKLDDAVICFVVESTTETGLSDRRAAQRVLASWNEDT